jgi:hypothetical protein
MVVVALMKIRLLRILRFLTPRPARWWIRPLLLKAAMMIRTPLIRLWVHPWTSPPLVILSNPLILARTWQCRIRRWISVRLMLVLACQSSDFKACFSTLHRS